MSNTKVSLYRLPKFLHNAVAIIFQIAYIIIVIRNNEQSIYIYIYTRIFQTSQGINIFEIDQK